MKYILDTHTHTIASGHAYNTLFENAKEASEYGLKILATTDHGPAMPGGPHMYHFTNAVVLPRKLYDIILLHGCEANIIDYQGSLDINERALKNLDLIIASLHDVCIKSGNRDENTSALIKVMDNPYVDIIGHSGNPAFPIWEEAVVKKAKEKNVLIEINNGSFGSRRGSEDNCRTIAALCKDYGVRIVLGSDAHVCCQIGRFPKAERLLDEVKMPEELIINAKENRILEYLKNKGKLKDLK